ncbi:MAG: ABC transporter substrate binding protein [Candidatus Sulfotelmatobacter sp.]
MRRREFITVGAAAVAWPLPAHAQQGARMGRVGILMPLGADDPEDQARLAAFLQGLQESGWSVGRNLRIDTRYGAGEADRLREYAIDLVALSPDVILAVGSSSVVALRQASRTMRTVFTAVSDPVGAGFVASLAHPGGSITGFANLEYQMGVKWLELLRQVTPPCHTSSSHQRQYAYRDRVLRRNSGRRVINWH